MATKHAKVDVVTIGAGWTSAILGAKLCPKGTTMVALTAFSGEDVRQRRRIHVGA